MNQQDIEGWMVKRQSQIFKYRLNYRVLTTFLFLGFFLIVGAIVLWIFGDWTQKQLLAIWLIVGLLNLSILVRVGWAIYFVGRNFLGISLTELVIIRGYKGIRIPFDALKDGRVKWNEQSPMRGASTLPIEFRNVTVRIPLITLYYSLEHFPGFMALFIDRVEK